jgi:hypothetical protein
MGRSPGGLNGSLQHRLGSILAARRPPAVSKLIAQEMPKLVDGWRTVSISARRTPGADGRTPDDTRSMDCS